MPLYNQTVLFIIINNDSINTSTYFVVRLCVGGYTLGEEHTTTSALQASHTTTHPPYSSNSIQTSSSSSGRSQFAWQAVQEKSVERNSWFLVKLGKQVTHAV